MPTWLLLAEDDNTLTEEEKAVARFQKERLKAMGGAAAVRVIVMPVVLDLTSDVAFHFGTCLQGVGT